MVSIPYHAACPTTFLTGFSNALISPQNEISGGFHPERPISPALPSSIASLRLLLVPLIPLLTEGVIKTIVFITPKNWHD